MKNLVFSIVSILLLAETIHQIWNNFYKHFY